MTNVGMSSQRCEEPRMMSAAADPVEQSASGFVDAILESLPDGLLLVSRTGVILRANEAAAKILRANQAALPGRSIHETVFKAPFASAFIAEALAKGAEVKRAHGIDGRRLFVSAKPLALSGSDQIVLILRDVTGLGQLVNRLQTSLGTASSDWAGMRRAESLTGETTTLVTKSRVIQAVRERALLYAPVTSPVLLLGETGTGKNVFARLIHDASPRRTGPFHVVNCGAIPEGLLEAQLFGYAKGAFTGADSRGRIGIINLAHTGTLVLDEVGDLPLGLQVKLLRFLEAGEVWPVGGTEAKHPDVRIIAATNRDLGRMMAEGAFRKDLFYRLHILVLSVPPLREHPEDIPALVEMMLEQLSRRLGMLKTLTPAAMEALLRHAFPGNIRELWNLVESLVVTVRAPAIDVSDLPLELAGPAASTSLVSAPSGLNLRQALHQLEAQIVREALRRYGTQSKAAQHLGVAQATVARKTKQHGLSV
jgi:transcriptional regulator with PAS, ATPase and Fis domain